MARPQYGYGSPGWLIGRHSIRLVGTAELVQMLTLRSACVNVAQGNRRSGNMDSPCELIKRVLRLPLYPYVQAVVTVWNILDPERSLRVRDALKRRAKRNHHCAHLRMDIAEDIRHAFARKNNAAC